MSSKVRMTKAERRQCEVADALCDTLGLPPGEFSRGGKHGKYTVKLPWGGEFFITIACTPRDEDAALSIVRKSFRHQLAELLS